MQRHDRYLGEPKLPVRCQSAVAGDDVAVLTDQNWIGEPEYLDGAALGINVSPTLLARADELIE